MAVVVIKSLRQKSEVRRSLYPSSPRSRSLRSTYRGALSQLPSSARLMRTRPVTANPIRKPPVIVHNKGGQIYDETRPSDWDKQRWK